MVATVGSISIDLSTNAAKFAQGFKASASTVEQQSARMSKAVDGVGRASKLASGILSGFIGGLVAGGVTQGINSFSAAMAKARQSLSDFEEIGNRARTVGLDTGFFQALSFGALKADVDQEKLNKSLEIFAKNVGLAKEGSGALFTGLKNLNPELLKTLLTTTDQEGRLKAVADALNQTSDATAKAALNNVIFGKGGADLVRVFDGGAAALAEFQRQAKDLGLIVPDELIQKAGELDDKLEILSKVIDLNLSQALVKAAPLLVAGAEGTAKLAQNLNELSGALDNFANNPSLPTFFEFLKTIGIEPTLTGGGAVGFIEDMLGAMERTIPNIKKEIQEVEEEIVRLQKSGEGGAGIIIEQDVQRLEELKAELATVRSEVRQAAAEATRSISAVNKARSNLAQQFRQSENASMGGGGSGPLPIVHGSNLGRKDGEPIRSTVNGVGVTSFGGSKDAQEFIKSIEDNKDATEDGFEENTSATDRTTDAIEKADRNTGRYFGDLGGRIGGGLANLNQNFATIGDAINALKAAGIDPAKAHINQLAGGADSLVGKQFDQQIGSNLFNALFDMQEFRELESQKLQTQLDRLRIQADAAGSLAADAFAVKIAQLELKIFDTQQTEAATALKPSLLDLGKLNYAGSFAEGGSFTVGGAPSGDKNLVSLFANAGETVTVSPPGQTGNTLVFNYNAAPGESERTARQNARAMLAEMQREQARL